MTPYDGVMVGLIVAGMLWGAIKGVTWQIASIASLTLAYFFSHRVSAYLMPYIPGEEVARRAGSMLGAYLVVSLGVFLAAWTVRATLRKMRFEAYDRHLGMILGGVEGALLGLVGTLFIVGLAPATRGPIFGSTSGHLVARVMDAAGPVLPEEVRKVVTPYWEHLNSPAVAMDSEQGPTATTPEVTPSDGASLGDLVRGTRSKIGKAVGDAVKSEVEQQLGDSRDDDRNPQRR